jgi:hypoxanthine phosphoribosyltransferase
VVDDINDSGSTIVGLRRALAEADAVIDNVRFAVLITNVRSAAEVEYWASEIDRSTDERWFVFPWESMASQSATEEDVQSYSERNVMKD